MSNKKLLVAAVLAGSLLGPGALSIGLTADAQTVTPASRPFWRTYTDPVFSLLSLGYWKPAAAGVAGDPEMGLRPGEKIVEWPDGTRQVVDRDGFLVSTFGRPDLVALRPGAAEQIAEQTLGPDTQPVSAMPPGSMTAAGATAAQACPPQAAATEAEPLRRASLLSPGNILIDEEGRRIQLTADGRMVTNALTPISMVPDWGPGSQLVNEAEMNPIVAQRVYGEDGRLAAGEVEVIPPTANATIIPPGATLAAVPVSTVAAGCPPGVGVTAVPTPVVETPVVQTPIPPFREIPVVAVPTCPQTAMLESSDVNQIQTFMQGRIRQANMTPATFLMLTPAQQQLVLAGEPVPAVVSGATPTFTVPPEVQAKLTTNGMMTEQEISQYATPLPAELNSQLAPLPTGYRRVFVGNSLVLLSPSNGVVDVRRGIIQ